MSYVHMSTSAAAAAHDPPGIDDIVRRRSALLPGGMTMTLFVAAMTSSDFQVRHRTYTRTENYKPSNNSSVL